MNHLDGIKRVYVSSPLTGYPDYRREKINKTVKKLREAYPNIEFLSPTEIAHDLFKERGDDFTYNDFVESLQFIIESSDAIAFMEGWKESDECIEEIFIGIEYGLKFFLVFNGKLFFNISQRGEIKREEEEGQEKSL